MVKLNWTPQAKHDLIAIAEYIAQDYLLLDLSPTNHKRLVFHWKEINRHWMFAGHKTCKGSQKTDSVFYYGLNSVDLLKKYLMTTMFGILNIRL